MIVTIEPGDAGFESSLCNKPWSNDLRAIKSPGSSFGDGTYFVGSEVRPGTWQASNPTSFCYWERLSGFSWELNDIITNDIPDGPTLVTISSTDAGFLTDGCGTWRYLG